MAREPPRSNRPSTPFPYTTPFRATRNLSPYEFNPTGYNPLRDLLTRLIDFDRLREQEAVQLMVCATNVRTARRRVFTNTDVSVEAVLASACLRSDEHTSELQSLMRISYTAICWKNKQQHLST